MSTSELVEEELNSKHGYENDGASGTFKILVQNKLWLYFGPSDENGGPYFGYWVEDTISDTTRQSLIKVLESWMFDENAGEIQEEAPFIYRTWNNTSVMDEDSIAKMIVDTMLELESQTQKMLVRMI
jgi:hypothetical protein